LLPSPGGRERHVRATRWSYAFNVCTYGYTMAWWDRRQFVDEELDRLALWGINMPLAFIGQEAAWLQLFTGLGLDDADVRAWFSGPAFLPWQRMGNMQVGARMCARKC
jgi:alpha-N-acetylglucosaminidase